MPLIALQHNPVYPDIDSSKYPYMITNTEDIRAAYADSSVFLSLSGHYHRGQEPAALNGVVYRTLPAICESPFRFDYIELRDTQVDITAMELKVPHDFLTDNHLHTQFAYRASHGKAAGSADSGAGSSFPLVSPKANGVTGSSFCSAG